MEQTVYVDIYFLINFSMDLLCFFLSSRLLSSRFHLKRVLLASAIGGIYSCVALFTYATGAAAMLIDLLACLGICGVAMKRKRNTREFLEFSIVYAAVSALLGGLMTALFSLFNKIGLGSSLVDEGDADGVSVWFFAFLALLSGAAALFGGRFFKKRVSRIEGSVKIEYGKRTLCLKALCDSGNLLTDPISSKPCVVAQRSEVERILPLGMARAIKSGTLERLNADEARRVRVIPTRTVNGGGILYAVRVDSLSIDMGNGYTEVDALVALGEVSDGAEGASALVPSSLVMGIK